MRTRTPSSVASNASIRTSSPTSSTWLRSGARFAGFRRDLASDLPALFALALVCLLGGRLEELTPELPDLADWARQGPERYNRRPGRRVDDRHGFRVRQAFGVNPDDPEVHSALLDHQRTDLGVTFQATRRRDLQPVRRDDVALYEAGDGHPLAANVRLAAGIRTDEKAASPFDLTPEVAEHRTPAPALDLPGEHVVPGQHRRFRLEPLGLGPAVRPRNVDLLRQSTTPLPPSKSPRPDPAPHP